MDLFERWMSCGEASVARCWPAMIWWEEEGRLITWANLEFWRILFLEFILHLLHNGRSSQALAGHLQWYPQSYPQDHPKDCSGIQPRPLDCHRCVLNLLVLCWLLICSKQAEGQLYNFSACKISSNIYFLVDSSQRASWWVSDPCRADRACWKCNHSALSSENKPRTKPSKFKLSAFLSTNLLRVQLLSK